METAGVEPATDGYHTRTVSSEGSSPVVRLKERGARLAPLSSF
jgi:hypothetical protein